MDPKPTPDNAPVIANGSPPAPPAERPPATLSDWFRENWVKLLFVGVIIAAICRYLHPLDLLLAGGGLSLIIFLHELGHFAAAKLCDVHVKMFSIGFGPALPFCQFKYGETTYKLAMIPLGGFVAMVGEGDEEGDVVEGEPDPEVAASDPRSFKNKPVWQRMIIISAGVVMNIILGCICFVATYMHGVQELPAIASHVEPGSAAWRIGMHSGTEITRINNREHPWFDDVRPIVSSTSAGETVNVDLEYQGTKRTLTIEPLRSEGALYPQLGIAPPEKLVLRHFRRDDTPPYPPGSPAAAVVGEGFRPGDRLMAMTDPAEPSKVTPFDPKPNGLPGAVFDYERRLRVLAGQQLTFHVLRLDEPESAAPTTITVPAAYRAVVPGLRMRMGKVAAVRIDSPAAKAGIQTGTDNGDEVVGIEVREPDGKLLRYGSSADDVGKLDPTQGREEPLDPLKLPFQLNQWSDRQTTDRKVTVTVLRQADHTRKRVALSMEWDPSFRYDLSRPTSPGSPVPVNGLGLAYHVEAVVADVDKNSAAAAAGLQRNDKIVQARFTAADYAGKETVGSWDDVPSHHWAFVDYKLQVQFPHKFDVKVVRDGQTQEISLAAVPDSSWPVADLRLFLTPDTRTQKADGILDALEMGAYRTTRSIRMIYQQLNALIFGRISVKLMSGPITLARMSYLLAGEDVWHLILWMGLISVNLAVVNFLPIPVLDGGHMVFLIYEAVRGKPAPVVFQNALTIVGLAMVGCLMIFVIGLDLWRLFFA